MSGLTSSQRRVLRDAGCEIRHDDLTRRLYATDASNFEVLPRAVALPRSPAEVAAAMRAAAEAGLPVTPRGAGTGLAGGAVGDGLIIDLSSRERSIFSLDPEAGTAHVAAGVVLDQLNQAALPHGLWFGPDVATSSRATLGGMIANCSSGARAPIYGTTIDHVLALEVVCADGATAVIGKGHDGLAELRDAVARCVSRHAAVIEERLLPKLRKRRPGYCLADALQEPDDLTRIVAGSEGTLAVVTAAWLRLVPIPARRGLAVLFFASVSEAMQATVELLELQPAAIEHIDHHVFDRTKGQRAFAAARSLLRLDEHPTRSLLLVELCDDSPNESVLQERLAALEKLGLGQRIHVCADEHEQQLVWALRKAGLSLVTASPGPAKTTTCIEDVCVQPQQLPEYVAALQGILAPLGLEASFYGHAASGQLHVRPTLDLHTADGVAKLRLVSDQVSELCRQFHGSISGEHGVGMARTEYLPRHLGPALLAAHEEIKRLWDPHFLLNPEKIVSRTGRFHMDTDLRLGAGRILELPFPQVLGFVDRDHSFGANLEQCNGCGGCRKDTPVMCPTFVATGEEALSTRGRANIIRAALEQRFSSYGPRPFSPELDQVLDSCLSCKACRTECPSNVDMAQLKAELLNARHQVAGVPLRDRLIANADLLGRVGSATAPLANLLLGWRPLRLLLQALTGIDAGRSLPPFTRHRFDTWLARHAAASPAETTARRVLLWDDTWVRYHEPGIGIAAVRVLEAAGLRVELVEDRRCCGRPAASRGLLAEVRRLGEHNLRLLDHPSDDTPILFLEPSCYTMFIDEYRQLELPGAEAVARRCFLLEDFLLDLLERDQAALQLAAPSLHVAIHSHCHSKALADPHLTVRLLERIEGATIEQLDTGCCGMAGAFGLLHDHQTLSHQVAASLLELITALPEGTRLVAAGTSCRHQITDLTGTRPWHPAELLAEALPEGTEEEGGG